MFWFWFNALFPLPIVAGILIPVGIIECTREHYNNKNKKG